MNHLIRGLRKWGIVGGFCVVIFLSSHCAFADDLTISSTSGAAGASVNISVSANFTSAPAQGIVFDVQYDSTILNFVSVVNGAALDGTWDVAQHSVLDANHVRILLSGNSSTVSSGAIATLTFSVNASPGGASCSLTPQNVTYSDSGGINLFTINTLNVGTFTVNAVPTITVQPSDTTVSSGATAGFSVTATGATSYQWQKSTNGGSSYSNVVGGVGATTSSYTTPVTSSTDDQAKFRCVVTNAQGSVNSNAATLTVNFAPIFTTNPVNQTVASGATTTFTVATNAEPALTTYQWKSSTDGGSTFNNVVGGSGATSLSYVTPATSSSDNATQFECVATNSQGNTTSTVATLTVNSAPSISVQPTNQSANAPATVTFSITATGNPLPTYQWKKSTDGGSTFSNVVGGSGAATSSYTTPATSSADDQAQYKCVVTNSQGNVTSSAVILTVQYAPTISVQPSNQTIASGAAATFSVTAAGNPAPTYQWKSSTDGGSTFNNVAGGSGATSASYTTAATSSSDDGTQFECVVTNLQGNTTSTIATLTINSAPSISVQPTNQSVNAPATATFSITAGGNPSPSYQWKKSTNGGSTFSNVVGGSGATSSSYTTPTTSGPDDQAQYECVVSNSQGNVTSSAATLTVQYAPTISVQPSNQTIISGATANFSVTAAGNPSPTYQWKKSTDGGSTFNNVVGGSGATTSSYTTPATSSSDDQAQYECVISNARGNVTSNAATLTIQYAPTISVQPSNQTVNVGATATFSVTAAANPSPTYQWKKSTNGGSTFTSIGGATSSSYTTPATSSSDDQTQYECVLTNSIGNVTSNAVTLSVLMNGQCAAVENTCTVGTSISQVLAAGHYTWSCQGLNGGTTAACSNYALTTTVTTTNTGTGNVYCGSIGTACPVSVPATTSETFYENPAVSSNFTGWAGDCASAGRAATCTVTVNAATTASANFDIKTFAINASVSGANGDFTINGGGSTTSSSTNINYGDNVTIVLSPTAGYVANLTVDGTAVTLSSNTYTISNVTAAHTLVASFAQYYIINAPVVPLGGLISAYQNTMSGSGDVRVNSGVTQRFIIVAKPGYGINQVKVDGFVLTANVPKVFPDGTSVTFDGSSNCTYSNVHGTHPLVVTFKSKSLNLRF